MQLERQTMILKNIIQQYEDMDVPLMVLVLMKVFRNSLT